MNNKNKFFTILKVIAVILIFVWAIVSFFAALYKAVFEVSPAIDILGRSGALAGSVVVSIGAFHYIIGPKTEKNAAILLMEAGICIIATAILLNSNIVNLWVTAVSG